MSLFLFCYSDNGEFQVVYSVKFMRTSINDPKDEIWNLFVCPWTLKLICGDGKCTHWSHSMLPKWVLVLYSEYRSNILHHRKCIQLDLVAAVGLLQIFSSRPFLNLTRILSSWYFFPFIFREKNWHEDNWYLYDHLCLKNLVFFINFFTDIFIVDDLHGIACFVKTFSVCVNL